MDLHVYGLDPVTLNVGLMKPRRGFTLVAGEEKLGVGKSLPTGSRPIYLRALRTWVPLEPTPCGGPDLNA